MVGAGLLLWCRNPGTPVRRRESRIEAGGLAGSAELLLKVRLQSRVEPLKILSHGESGICRKGTIEE
jgi:hypothetical protein